MFVGDGWASTDTLGTDTVSYITLVVGEGGMQQLLIVE